MTAYALITHTALPRNPTRRFATDRTGTLVAVLTPSGDWYPVATQTITGQWVPLPYEILANGRRMIEITPGNRWGEVTRSLSECNPEDSR